jgi:hypothetical protein
MKMFEHAEDAEAMAKSVRLLFDAMVEEFPHISADNMWLFISSFYEGVGNESS